MSPMEVKLRASGVSTSRPGTMQTLVLFDLAEVLGMPMVGMSHNGIRTLTQVDRMMWKVSLHTMVLITGLSFERG